MASAFLLHVLAAEKFTCFPKEKGEDTWFHQYFLAGIPERRNSKVNISSVYLLHARLWFSQVVVKQNSCLLHICLQNVLPDCAMTDWGTWF